MKIELDINSDSADALIVLGLQASVRRAIEIGDEPEYDKRYIEAANLVIEHFGGKPIS